VGVGVTFRIVTGTVYGSNASPTTLRNTATNGAALYVVSNQYGSGTAERGTFDTDGEWVRSGSLSTTTNTIRMVNGLPQ